MTQICFKSNAFKHQIQRAQSCLGIQILLPFQWLGLNSNLSFFCLHTEDKNKPKHCNLTTTQTHSVIALYTHYSDMLLFIVYSNRDLHSSCSASNLWLIINRFKKVLFTTNDKCCYGKVSKLKRRSFNVTLADASNVSDLFIT